MKKLPHVELPPLIDHRPRERAERDRIVNTLRKQQGLPVGNVEVQQQTKNESPE